MHLRHIALLVMIAIIAKTAYAAFPYSAQWLQYADERIVYQIDTSKITSNTATIYVELNIDPTTLQNYINKWSAYCDPAGRYDWFYPTFTYASTQNQSERMAKIVKYYGWRTFTVGSCGDVNLPTSFIIEIPNGTLDGGSSFSNYQHYIYAYLKYPYSDDFSDNPIGYPPEEYNSTTTRSISFNSSFGRGNMLDALGSPEVRDLSIDVDLSSTKPLYICVGQGNYFCVNEKYYLVTDSGQSILLGASSGYVCYNATRILRNAGLSGVVHIKELRMEQGYCGCTYCSGKIYWWWIIPQETYRQIMYGDT
ncbi:MAG: hypothetical protein GXO43_01275 [Crenarchaeota archaeon]|nr:hypothetical protein [Thermoproteota archaeon]